MHNKDHYLLFSLQETIEKILRYCSVYQNVEEFYQNDRVDIVWQIIQNDLPKLKREIDLLLDRE